MIKVWQINLAKSEILSSPKDKRDLFIKLAAFNLLNAAVKIPEFSKMVSYGQFKPLVGVFIDNVLNSLSLKNELEHLYISAKESCCYIKCGGLQFSFHNISYTPIILRYTLSKDNFKQAWEGIRLQKIAEDIFILAEKWKKHEITTELFEYNIKQLRKMKPLEGVLLKEAKNVPSDSEVKYYFTVFQDIHNLLAVRETLIKMQQAQNLIFLRKMTEESFTASFHKNKRDRLGLAARISEEEKFVFSYEPKSNGEIPSKVINNLTEGAEIVTLSNEAFNQFILTGTSPL